MLPALNRYIITIAVNNRYSVQSERTTTYHHITIITIIIIVVVVIIIIIIIIDGFNEA